MKFLGIGTPKVKVTYYGSGGAMTAQSNNMASLVWGQIVLVYNGAGTLTFTNWAWYFNGQNVGLDTANCANGAGSPGSDVSLNMTFGTNASGCLYDHAILWNRALSGSEIVELYESPFCFMQPQGRRSMLAGAGQSTGQLNSRRAVTF